MYNTVSLEVAKKLKEAGWRKETYFMYFIENYHNRGKEVLVQCTPGIESLGDYPEYSNIAAPQLHDLLEELPYKISIGTANIFFKMDIFEDNYHIGYYEFGEYPWGEQINENPHDAAAKLLIWCVKNNYITL